MTWSALDVEATNVDAATMPDTAKTRTSRDACGK
jgi:hypothetical protein